MIKQLIIILLIFAILILGQQTYFRKVGFDIYKKAEGWGISLWQKAQDYWNIHILNKVTTEIEKRQDIAKQEIKQQTKEVGQTIWDKIRNYVTGLFNGIFSQQK